jgi:hypothetical protein
VAEAKVGEMVAVVRTRPESVVVLDVIAKLMLDAVAEECAELAAIDAARVQVPGATKATKPDEELIVQTEVVELV